MPYLLSSNSHFSWLWWDHYTGIPSGWVSAVWMKIGVIWRRNVVFFSCPVWNPLHYLDLPTNTVASSVPRWYASSHTNNMFWFSVFLFCTLCISVSLAFFSPQSCWCTQTHIHPMSNLQLSLHISNFLKSALQIWKREILVMSHKLHKLQNCSDWLCHLTFCLGCYCRIGRTIHGWLYMGMYCNYLL